MRDAGVTIDVREDVEIVSVGAFRDKVPAVVQRATDALGVSLQDGPVRSSGRNVELLGVGPRRWLCVRDGGGQGLAAEIATAFEGLAAVNDQSDAFVVMEVSGPGARALLARGVAVDLRPESLTAATVAVTTVAHTNVVLWRRESPEAQPRLCLAIPRSYRESFRASLEI